MANRPNIIREMVSGQRKRYTEDGFNLDLSYITHNIIAMGFPAENMEAFYRNKREDVLKFLNEKHDKKYKVYNLCAERSYIGEILFPYYDLYPFKDHNPPDIELINKFCKDVHNFLSADRSHVVAIHCKAGKGRTGTMICCYLLYSNTFQTANEALTYYAEKRTKDKKGVTIPSQRRYVQYYEQLLRNNLKYKEVSLYILELRISPADVPLKSGSIKLKGTKDPLPLVDFQRSGDYILVVLDRCMPLKGDVKVEFGRTKLDKGWHFWFNTFFVERAANYDSQGRLVLTLDKMEIDDAHKGNARKCPEQVQVFLKPSVESPESLVRYRLLSEPEIVNLLASTPSGGSEVSGGQQRPMPASTGAVSVASATVPAARPNRCSGNSFDASSSSASGGSPSGIENNGSSSSAGSGTSSSSSSSGAAQPPPVKSTAMPTSTTTAQPSMVEV